MSSFTLCFVSIGLTCPSPSRHSDWLLAGGECMHHSRSEAARAFANALHCTGRPVSPTWVLQYRLRHCDGAEPLSHHTPQADLGRTQPHPALVIEIMIVNRETHPLCSSVCARMLADEGSGHARARRVAASEEDGGPVGRAGGALQPASQLSGLPCRRSGRQASLYSFFGHAAARYALHERGKSQPAPQRPVQVRLPMAWVQPSSLFSILIGCVCVCVCDCVCARDLWPRLGTLAFPTIRA
jgi:hypothetical protein